MTVTMWSLILTNPLLVNYLTIHRRKLWPLCHIILPRLPISTCNNSNLFLTHDSNHIKLTKKAPLIALQIWGLIITDTNGDRDTDRNGDRDANREEMISAQTGSCVPSFQLWVSYCSQPAARYYCRLQPQPTTTLIEDCSQLLSY